MNTSKTLKPYTLIFTIYIICYLARILELFFIRTDQTFFGEAFIHKLIGVIILACAIGYLRLKPSEIFGKNISKGLLFGFAIGLGCYFIAYLTEYIILANSGAMPSLQFYTSAFGIDGNKVGSTTLLTVSMCILFNILNVIMEEGIFRGLFIKLGEKRFNFLWANTISALLFGLWHIALPIRSFGDGDMTATGAVASALTYILTTFLAGFQFGLLAKITGGLWAPMAAHFVNNTIVNLLHVSAVGGDDSLMFARITIAQVLYFVVILIAYIKWHKNRIAKK